MIKTPQTARAAQPTKINSFRVKRAERAADPIDTAVCASSRELPRLFTPVEVAEQLGVARRTLDRWRLTGEGPAFVKLSAQTVRYTADAVSRFVTERLKANTAQ